VAIAHRNVLPLLAYGAGAAVLYRALLLMTAGAGRHGESHSGDADDEDTLEAIARGIQGHKGHGMSPSPGKGRSPRLVSGHAEAVGCAHSPAHRRGAGLLLCWLLVLLPLFPALNVLFPVGALLAERLLFMPSVGFCLGALSCAMLC